MAHKKKNLITAEVFMHENFHRTEQEHLFEHVFFLEERTAKLEEKIEDLKEIVGILLEIDDEEEDIEEDEDDEDEDEIWDKVFPSRGHCFWDDEE